jgi:hypothetical protein
MRAFHIVPPYFWLSRSFPFELAVRELDSEFIIPGSLGKSHDGQALS